MLKYKVYVDKKKLKKKRGIKKVSYDYSIAKEGKN
jgi:hypothetical protein